MTQFIDDYKEYCNTLSLLQETLILLEDAIEALSDKVHIARVQGDSAKYLELKTMRDSMIAEWIDLQDQQLKLTEVAIR